VESPSAAVDHERVSEASATAGEPAHRRFRLGVIFGSVVAAIVGSVVLATHYSGDQATTRGITATLRVPGHPGSVAAGRDGLWVALIGDPRKPVADRALLRLDLATGTVRQTVRVSGEVSFLARDGQRLIASVKPVGGSAFGPRRLVALDWRTGAVLGLGDSHRNDADAREFDGPVDRVVRAGNSLWALELRPGRLWRLDPSTLAPSAAPIRLSNGRTPGMAAGEGYLWVTAADTGEVLRIDPLTRAITRVHVGGFPVGIIVTGGNVWIADRSGGNVIRLDPVALRPIGDPTQVGGKPNWLAALGGSVFVTGADTGTIARVDVHSGRTVGPPIRVAPAAEDGVAPAVASSGGSLWVTSFASSTVARISPSGGLSAGFSEVTFKGTGDGPVDPGPNGMGVTNGGVAGTGQFTATGAISDKGRYTSYRRVVGMVATVRTVLAGAKGAITMVATIHLDRESPAPWTITAGTTRYAGLRGQGRLIVDNFESNPYTFVMKGTVSR
jgi:hypothetical protein